MFCVDGACYLSWIQTRRLSPRDVIWQVKGVKQDWGLLNSEPLQLLRLAAPVAWGERRNTQKAAAPEGAAAPKWWQMWRAHGGRQSWVLPELCLAGKDSQEPEVRFWETQGFQQWDLRLSFAFLMKKQFQTLPIISLYNTENSHNCPSYFPKYNKNKGKKVSLFHCICSQNIQWLEWAMSFGSDCWTTLWFCQFHFEGHGNSWRSAFCFHSFAPAPVPKAIGREWLDPDS